jgi:hypothetical protein
MSAITLRKIWVEWEANWIIAAVACSVALPFLVHCIPNRSALPLGAQLLPMFYAPFIAAFFFRPHVGMITAFIAPLMNSWLTGLPVKEKIGFLTAELLIFTLISLWLIKKFPRFWGSAPLAYVASTVICSYCFGAAHLFTPLHNSLTGMALLLFINYSLNRYPYV